MDFQLPSREERRTQAVKASSRQLGDEQRDYFRKPAALAGLEEDSYVEEYLQQTNQAMWNHTYAQRGAGVPGENDNYRLFSYQRDDGNQSFAVRQLEFPKPV
jgi:hypothetical protein